MQYTKLAKGGLWGLLNLPKNENNYSQISESLPNPILPKYVEGFIYGLM
jgi:hypothetical protein